MIFLLLQLKDEPKAISYLIESQGLHHRSQVRYRYIKSEIKENNDKNQPVYGLDPSYFDLGLDSMQTYDKLLLKLKELPSGKLIFLTYKLLVDLL